MKNIAQEQAYSPKMELAKLQSTLKKSITWKKASFALSSHWCITFTKWDNITVDMTMTSLPNLGKIPRWNSEGLKLSLRRTTEAIQMMLIVACIANVSNLQQFLNMYVSTDYSSNYSNNFSPEEVDDFLIDIQLDIEPITRKMYSFPSKMCNKLKEGRICRHLLGSSFNFIIH
ncbi:hypothetical protein T07_3456 [Trichinella nelsoni]|uniref:Uncharacterized protein n=1 Tax=Trichinella nelsoni TaxID=6336 RepID=A0A0V0S9N0_9BILA|nr:hypothetical protein T07_3456 [Trichinella nelsoni]